MKKKLSTQTWRSLAFNIGFYGWTALVCVIALPVAPFLTARQMRRYAAFWMAGMHRILSLTANLNHRVTGLERLPQGPVLFASKHQSAWETMAFHSFRVDTVVGLKHELTKIPLFGWYLLIAGNIKIDRGGAAKSLRSLLHGAKAAAANGLSILVFPEGTRRAPHAPPDYKSGIAALYAALDLPCVPVALNSGVFWGRQEAAKRPGMITLEILEPIPPGLSRQAFMAELQARIEPATDRLVAEAEANLARG